MVLPSAETSVPEKTWLGLATDHRRLFDALQDGWLHPLPSRTDIVLGIERYAEERAAAQDGYPIEVHLKLNPEKLPKPKATSLHGEQWGTRTIREIESSGPALHWPGVLPTFAIQEVAVSSEEERARLMGMARFTSNLILPEGLVRVIPESENVFSNVSPLEAAAKLTVPRGEDSIHGAICMAVWAVPRIDPWLDLLVTTLAPDPARLPELAAEVDASWWRFPPWIPSLEETWRTDTRDCLWRAAVDTLSNQSVEDRIAPRELVERIADAARNYSGSGNTGSFSSWLQATHGILRGESVIRLGCWQTCPVGKAIQLVLTRPDPLRFKTWFQDLPDLPPAIAWTAATLCGLLHGYRRLDTHFRGDAFQQEILSILALRACAEEARELDWPSLASGGPRWRRDCGSFVLSWGDTEFARRPEKARGRWYAANFDDARVAHDARMVAKKRNWPCTNREIVLKDTHLLLHGPGTLQALDKSGSQFEVKGEVRLPVSERVTIEEVFDAKRFRRLIAVEGGHLPNPPVLQADGMTAKEPDVPGLTYRNNFVTQTEEEKIVAEIDRRDWLSDIKRRVQHYGWRYDYKARKVDPSMYIGPLPDWADKLAHRLVRDGLVPRLPDQVIVNEYISNQGIRAHSDSSSFDDGIATVSLLESWEMVFQEKGTKRKVKQVLERRSVAIMSGDARYRWTHEIPSRKTEPGRVKPGRVERGRRISLTFRKVIAPPDGKHKSG